MRIFASAEEAQVWSLGQKSRGYLVGFVPTMGFLHEGHLSLVDVAKKEADKVVVSIFVNPTQFAPGEDFDSYPRNVERDIELLHEKGVDAVYLPQDKSMYGPGYQTYVEVGDLTKPLCGAGRPSHFKGVTTVVTKLFHTVQPNVAVFGQKDAQQARIIERMTEDLQFGIKIIVAPIVRENDGLAMSSRNVRLLPDHRKQAIALNKGLTEAKEAFKSGERKSPVLTAIVRDMIVKDAPDGDIEYIEMVEWDNLQPVTNPDKTSMIAVAVRFGNVRLIDNTLLEL